MSVEKKTNPTSKVGVQLIKSNALEQNTEPELVTAYKRMAVQKADASTQIDRDSARMASDWLEPLLPLQGLEQMVDNSIIIPQCIRAYKNNIAGFGIQVKYKEGDQKDTPEAKDEWDRTQDIVNLLSIEEDTKTVFENIIDQKETFGIAYAEIIRDNAGAVTQIITIKDTPSVRMTKELDPYIDYVYFYKGNEIRRKKKFRKFKQEINGQVVYYKEFGDPRPMDYRTGTYSRSVPKQFRANEILCFRIGMKPYGKVRWIGQILGADGVRMAETLNHNYFVNGRHTPMAILISGGTLTDKSYKQLQTYMNDIQGLNGQHAFMLIETESLDTGFDGNPATVQLVPLANILQKDELFQDYTENTRKRVQSAFNLPDLYVGYTQDFNRATAQTAIEVTEKQVFQPERASLAWIINNKLLNGYNLQYCEVEFDGPDLTNPDDIFKLLSVAERAGGVTPNMAKAIANDALGQESEDYEGDWGNVPVVISNAQATQQMLTGAPSRESAQKTENEEETDKAKTPDIDPSVKDKLDGQIEKAEQENADDAVIAVMKQVRSLLVEIRKQAGEEA
jgi:PBSX family phage portal protein